MVRFLCILVLIMIFIGLLLLACTGNRVALLALAGILASLGLYIISMVAYEISRCGESGLDRLTVNKHTKGEGTMFGFTEMLDTLEERKIGRFEKHEDGALACVVSTVLVTDAEEPYETAVSHLDYNPGRWAIVATYPDEEQAALGHAAWIEKMTAKTPPKCLVDVGTSEISKLRDEVEANTDWRTLPAAA